KTGSSLQRLFGKAAQTIENSGKFERELVVKTSQAKLSAKIVGFLPLILLVLIAFISTDFREGLSHPVGLISVGIGLFLDALGLLLIKSILNLEVSAQ
ncbi:MAG: type II secretion protein F, partial [Coriobacteriia bacterium]|nr:type II secretion protein F [Coriobacteriia bacterium]